MRRLIVGCGYLGGRVARSWREAGDTVYATTRGERADLLARLGFRPLTLDVTDVPPMTTLPQVDTVMFAVGRDRRTGVTMRDIHETGLRAVLDALPPTSGRVIYISSSGVHGQDSGEWVDEESTCEPVSAGGQACISGERLLSRHPRGRGAVVLRLAGLYGRGRVPYAAHVTSALPIAGAPDGFLNLLHIDDAAAAVSASANVFGTLAPLAIWCRVWHTRRIGTTRPHGSKLSRGRRLDVGGALASQVPCGRKWRR
jgi:nucleoside-diphosphate-sugar epimerase